ncbi:MAG: hypothetical protein KF832_24040 [Caldilineaceae bacterium]|nr:hypothetical protein [Caldilineaceae bacterium]
MINPGEVRPPTKPPSRFALYLAGGLVLITLLMAQWFWLTRSLMPTAAAIPLPAERAPLWDALFRQPPIVWSLSLAGVVLLVALVAALSPLRWWGHLMIFVGRLPGTQQLPASLWGEEPQSVEAWVAAQAELLGVPPDGQVTTAEQPVAVAQAAATAPVPGQPGVQPPGTPGQPEAQAPAAPQPAPGQPGVQPPGTPSQPEAQAPAAPQPGVLPPGAQPHPPAPPDAQQPGTTPPNAPPPGGLPPGGPIPATPQDLQQLLAQTEALDVKELTDIGDILSSFKENDEVSEHLLTLSRSLDEVEIRGLVTKLNQVANELNRLNALDPV